MKEKRTELGYNSASRYNLQNIAYRSFMWIAHQTDQTDLLHYKTVLYCQTLKMLFWPSTSFVLSQHL